MFGSQGGEINIPRGLMNEDNHKTIEKINESYFNESAWIEELVEKKDQQAYNT